MGRSRTHACRLTLAWTLALACALLAAPLVRAATPPLTATHVTPPATYTGWAYLRAPGATASLWKWNSTGWTATSVPAGSPAWALPFASGWMWVWMNGAWHATQSGNLGVWTCAAVGGDSTIAVGGSGATLRQRTSTGATTLQALAAGERLNLACANGFADADSTRSAVHAMVRTAAGTTGYVEVARLVAGSAPVSPTGDVWTVPLGSRPVSAPISLRDCTDVTISNRTFRDFGANVIAIRLENCHRVTIDSVDFINVAEGVYAVNSSDIRIVRSRYSNIVGPHERVGANRANFVQFDNVQNSYVGHNKGRGGDTEDIVSVFKSNNVVVEYNHFEGTNWTSPSGSAIALGDAGGSYNVARHNVVVNPGQVGIFISGGTGNQVTDNVIIGQQRPSSNVGIYVWDQSGGTCSNATVARNRVYWLRADGQQNNFWNGNNCGPVAMSGNAFGDTSLNIANYRVVL